MDPNVARLIERTRARRGILHSTATDGSPLPRYDIGERTKADA